MKLARWVYRLVPAFLVTAAYCLPFSQATIANSNTIINLEYNNPNVLDWTDAWNGDYDDWIFTNNSNLGDRDDLTKVYYHRAANLYVKVSVAARWNWGGINAAHNLKNNTDKWNSLADDDPQKIRAKEIIAQYPDRDDNSFSPKIVNNSFWGTGGYEQQLNQEDVLLFSINATDDGDDTTVDGKNTLKIEFFADAALTKPAEVEDLNFVLTDLDSGNSNTEQIIVETENIEGQAAFIYFDRPKNSQIDDRAIVTNTVTGVNREITDASGNIAPVVMGKTHKLSLTYQFVNAPTIAHNINLNRHAYISNLSWNGDCSYFPGDPGECVTIPYAD